MFVFDDEIDRLKDKDFRLVVRSLINIFCGLCG